MEKADLDSFLELSSDLLCIAGTDGYFKILSPAWEALLGYSIGELLARPYAEFIHPEDRSAAAEELTSVAAGAGTLTFENRYVCKDQSIRWLAWRTKPDSNHQLMFAVARDVTERKEAEDDRFELRGKDFFGILIEKTTDIITILGKDGNIRYSTPSIETSLGHSPAELLGKRFFEFVHPEDRAGADALLAKLSDVDRAETPTSYRVRHRDGSWRNLETTGRNLLDEPRVKGVVLNSRDVTESRRLQDQFHQSQKMEIVGRLAGGVAHDFNNLLTLINGYSEIVMDELAPKDAMRKEVGEILKAGLRAAALTRQLLAFSRKQILELQPVSVNRIVGESVAFLRRTIGEDIELSVNQDKNLGMVMADAGQMNQLLMNLAVNSRDAMPNGGRLTISTSNIDLDETYTERHSDLTPGPYILLSVADTGTGMTQNILSHMFEPFYTTKGLGKGTGLGLSMVYGIVKQSKGHVWAESEPGVGTTFNVFLPRVADVAAFDYPSIPPSLTLRGTETILLVEDDEDVRTLTRRNLERVGYTVIESNSPADALLVCEDPGVVIDMILTDVVMPRLSGPQLVRRILQHRAGLKALYMSGFTEHPSLDASVGVLDAPLIQKPFSRDLLLLRVREVLAGSTAKA